MHLSKTFGPKVGLSKVILQTTWAFMWMDLLLGIGDQRNIWYGRGIVDTDGESPGYSFIIEAKKLEAGVLTLWMQQQFYATVNYMR